MTEISQIDGVKNRASIKIHMGSSLKDSVWLLLIIFFFAVIFFFLAIFLNTEFNFNLSNDSITLTFIGILATFIVVSNYMQVRDVKKEFREALEDIKNDFEKTLNNIGSLKKEIDGVESRVTKQENDINKEFNILNTKILTNSNIDKELDPDIIDYKILLYYKTLEALIHYNSKNYIASLHSCMTGLGYLNRLNEKINYSFENITYYIRRLSAESISNQIRISIYEKNAYLEVLLKYKGVDRNDLIEFIEKIKTM